MKIIDTTKTIYDIWFDRNKWDQSLNSNSMMNRNFSVIINITNYSNNSIWNYKIEWNKWNEIHSSMNEIK